MSDQNKLTKIDLSMTYEQTLTLSEILSACDTTWCILKKYLHTIHWARCLPNRVVEVIPTLSPDKNFDIMDNYAKP